MILIIYKKLILFYFIIDINKYIYIYYNMSDIKYKIIEKQESINGLGSNFLKFKLSGSDINYIIVNSLVRVGLSLVGSFAWNPDFINIERDTSIFNQDYMRLRLSNIPIINKDYNNMVVANNPDLVTKCLDLEVEANTSIFSS